MSMKPLILAALVLVLAIPGAAQEAAPPALAADAPIQDSLLDEAAGGGSVQSAPRPLETELLAFTREKGGGVWLYAIQGTGLAGGLALSAWGLSLAMDGVSGGLDSSLIHRGLAITVAGSVLISIFASLSISPPP
jgi:hypothetical protein